VKIVDNSYEIGLYEKCKKKAQDVSIIIIFENHNYSVLRKYKLTKHQVRFHSPKLNVQC